MAAPTCCSIRYCADRLAERVLDFMKAMPGLSVVSRSDPVSALSAQRKIHKAVQRLFYVYDIRCVGLAGRRRRKRRYRFLLCRRSRPGRQQAPMAAVRLRGCCAMNHESDIIPNYPPAATPDRLPIAGSLPMFARFKRDPRMTLNSSFTEGGGQHSARRYGRRRDSCLSNGARGHLRFLRAVFASDRAQGYFDFWEAVLNRQKPSCT